MILFSRKHTLLKTPLFEGFKDYHNHILPAVDDGVKSMKESLEILAYFESLKIKSAVLTPHVMAGVNNTSEAIESAYEKLLEAYNGPIELSLASEYMLDYNFDNHLENGARLIDGSNILVETSYFSAPSNLDELLYNIASSDLTPIIAHPERYRYMERKKYHELKDCDYAFQLNLLSFTDIYGAAVTKNALYLLEQDMYNIIGTDLHGLQSFKSRLSKIKLSTKHIDRLLKLKYKTL